MEPLRESLIGDFFKRIEKELGREATLRLLWPQVVGPQLAANTQLKSIRGAKLIISVPDRSWLTSLAPLETMIVAAANRLGGAAHYQSIEVLEDPQVTASRGEQNGSRRAARPFPAGQAEKQGSALAEIDAGMIADEKLRSVFLESAKRYSRACARGNW